jgi:tetrahydromethanopterin S-methyltransferase subunit C
MCARLWCVAVLCGVYGRVCGVVWCGVVCVRTVCGVVCVCVYGARAVRKRARIANGVAFDRLR